MDHAVQIDGGLLARRRAVARERGRRRLVVLLSGIGLVMCVGGYQVLKASSVFAVRSVDVRGGPPALDAQVRQLLMRSSGGRNLLSVDASSLERTVEGMPYVRSVTVDRAFPNALSVTLVPYHPAVAAAVGGSTYLVASDGRVLSVAAKQPPHLAAVVLPGASKLTVGTTARDPNLQAALAVLTAAPPQFGRRLGAITRIYSGGGSLTAVIGRHLKIKLGVPTQLALKLRVAARVLSAQGANRSRLAYVDVSAPLRVAQGIGFRS